MYSAAHTDNSSASQSMECRNVFGKLDIFAHIHSGSVFKTLPSKAGGVGLIPGQGAKIPHASWTKKQNIKQKLCCNKFNKDFKNDPHPKNKKNLI